MVDDNEVTLVAPKDENCGFEHCQEPAIYRCHKCGRLFCLEHASEVNPTFNCSECIKPADCEVIEMPLVDTDGVRHHGRVIRPVGVAFTENFKLISELTDDELKKFIGDYQALLHQAENVTQLYRVSLTQATHEALSRDLMKQKPGTNEFVFTVPVRKEQKIRKTRSTPSLEDKLVEALSKMPPELLKAFLDKYKKKAS